MSEWLDALREEWSAVGRRMRGLAMISRGIVPHLKISQGVVDRIVKAAQRFLADETGETMVGVVLPASHTPEAMPTIVVLDTIAPDDNAIRRSHMFEQGDELQGDIFVWLYENWQAFHRIGRDLRGSAIKPEWKHELRHLGDWHKQPGYMIQPSGGDLMTALSFMAEEENQFEFLLVPIVTLGHDSVTKEEGATVNYFTVPMPDGTSLRMDWWYIHRDSRFFQPITPQIVPTSEMPTLAPYPWHILDQELLNDEMGLLEDEGMFLIGNTTVLWEVDGDLPLEICLIVGTAGTNKVLLVVTDWDYPKRPPTARIAEFKGIDPSMYIYDIFGKLWQDSQPAPTVTLTWNDEAFLADYAKAVFATLGVTPTPAPRRVSVPVETQDDNDDTA